MTLLQAMIEAYKVFGFDSKEGQRVRQIVDQAIYNSNNYIAETNKEYMAKMRKDLIKND